MTSGTLQKIEKRLAGLSPDSLRYRVLASLRRFRSSWVELGRLLDETARSGEFREWGYDDFRIYCSQELGLKAPTVKKLMVSYRYLQDREPRRLVHADEEGDSAPLDTIPDYQTVALLHRASGEKNLGPEAQARFHRLAFEGGTEEAALRKEIRSALAETLPAEKMSGDQDGRRTLAELRKQCRILRRKLAESRIVPRGLCERFERLLLEIEALE
ncbi:MAG: hypothetical protein V1918_10115 [Planctomycetota bacterium]